MTQEIDALFDAQLLQKYDTSAPRYTSYPTALEFNDSFTEQDFLRAVEGSSTRDLSLYLHIPFCHSLCYYCGCNKMVTRHQHKADEYLNYLAQEIHIRSREFKDYQVKQIHLGGGTPSFLTSIQMARLMGLLNKYFDVVEDADISIEIDPRKIELDYLDNLRTLGFNRLSIGVQDVDMEVQIAINRVQSSEFIHQLINRAKELEFTSVNVDLIYGLPHQNAATFEQTLEQVIKFDPDRISLFSYAHLPSRFAAQRKLKDEWLPSPRQKLDLMRQAIERLTDAGYVFIGMDHFAKPDDELSIAQRERTLHRNFQGYTTRGECDLLGLGVSSISAIGNCYGQNYKDLKNYYLAIESEGSALEKGVTLTSDDFIRRSVITELMCNLKLSKESISQNFNIDFDRYFARDLPQLVPFIEDNLLNIGITDIEVAPRARLLIRNICMQFDAYLNQQGRQHRFSRVF